MFWPLQGHYKLENDLTEVETLFLFVANFYECCFRLRYNINIWDSDYFMVLVFFFLTEGESFGKIFSGR